MVSANTLCKELLNVKNVVVEGADFYSDSVGVKHIRIHARPNAWHKDLCCVFRLLIHKNGYQYASVT